MLKHFTGNCHIYIDAGTERIEKQVRDVCVNSKTSYPGGAVCNAVEHLLFHKDVADQLLPVVCADLAAKGVEIRGDRRTCQLYPSAKPATPEDWATEYLAFIEATGHKPPVYWKGGKMRRFDRWIDIPLAEPVLHVSALEAEAYCRWAGRRLPTEAEW